MMKKEKRRCKNDEKIRQKFIHEKNEIKRKRELFPKKTGNSEVGAILIRLGSNEH